MRSILFDFGGTLDHDGVSWLERLYPIYQNAGLNVSLEEFRQAFYRCDDDLPQRVPLKGLSLEETVFAQTRAILEVLAPEQMDIAPVVVGHFLEQSRRYFIRNRHILQRLAKKYRLGIVSNFYGNLDGVLKSEGLFEFFSVVADSGVVGIKKPDPAIFMHAVKGLGAQVSECWMVGDSMPRDMRGAEALGMAHAWLGGGIPALCCPQGRAIKRLPDLEALLS